MWQVQPQAAPPQEEAAHDDLEASLVGIIEASDDPSAKRQKRSATNEKEKDMKDIADLFAGDLD